MLLQAYDRVPRSLFSLQGGRLLRLLLFVERLLQLHISAATAVYRQLERVLALPCRRLLEVSLELLQNENLAALAAAAEGSGRQGPAAAAAAAAAGDFLLQRDIAAGLLHAALRLTTEIATGYQALADAAVRQGEETRSSDSSSSSSIEGSSSSSSKKKVKGLGFPHYASLFRRLFSAVSSLANRGDTPARLALACVAAASSCCSRPFLCMLLSYELPQHSVSALLATVQGDQDQRAAALVAAPAAVCCLSHLADRAARQLTSAAQVRHESPSPSWCLLRCLCCYRFLPDEGLLSFHLRVLLA